MQYFPAFRKITTTEELNAFAAIYTRCSGFVVPEAYYASNQVFAVYWQKQMVGGFVLGTGERLRTLEVFAGAETRPALYQQLQAAEAYTEMCCFWMDPAFHKKTWLNFFVWLCVAYALWTFGTPQLIFGTNSVRLAALYSATPKCKMLHADYINHKKTFIFSGPRRDCLTGVAQILWYKIKRLQKLAGQKGAGVGQPVFIRNTFKHSRTRPMGTATKVPSPFID